MCGVEIERDFLPWLIDSAADSLHRQTVVRQVLDDMIRYVTSTRQALMDQLEAEYLLIQSGADQDDQARTQPIYSIRYCYCKQVS